MGVNGGRELMTKYRAAADAINDMVELVTNDWTTVPVSHHV